MNLFINKCRDVVNTLFNTQNSYSTEVSHGVKHNQQRTAHDRWHNQRNGDFAGNRKQAGTRNTGRFLQGRVHTFQCTANLDKYEREKIHNLYGTDAMVGVDIENQTGKTEGFDKEFVDITGVRR